ncbi:MAG: FtsW/RodA/SpoVE family cell cycle protein [Muribaculaceae bacterium]|nr:FtsW/RodA/SpoVE family cell cycle protein [Muribaculaceae bacterium]
MTEEKQTRFNEIAQKHGDPWIWGIYLALIVISIVESYSASSREVAHAANIYAPVIKQCAFLGVGAVLVFFLHRTDYNKSEFLLAMIPALAFITVGLLVYVMFFGQVINGARRSLSLLGFTIQPSELAKLSIVTLLSYILAKSQKNRDVSNGGLAMAAVAVLIYGGTMIKSGMTNTIILMAISLSMMLIGGAKLKKILVVLLVYAVLGGGFYGLKKHNEKTDEMISTENVVKDKEDRTQMRKGRISAWLESDSLVYRPITDYNQQEMFSRMAQAHGGWHGVGPGRSRECSRLPLAFSDYIYSIIIEETGLIGGLFVLVLYLWLLARAAMIVRRSKRVLPSLLVIGMASMITIQALCHMAINVGVFPVSGQPLPLVSAGGTSIIVMSVAFGVMLSVSRTIANYNNKNNKQEESILPEGLDAENPTQILPKNVWK